MTGREFSRWVTRMMADRDWNNTDLARALCVTNDTVALWKRSGTRPHTDLALKWVEAFDRSPGTPERRGRPRKVAQQEAVSA